MKEKFYEFYKLPDKKVNDIWEKGVLIVDTNVLLDLYRLGKESRKDLKKSIEYFGDRIWLPYQASLEFHRNRENTIKELGGRRYEEFNNLLNNKIEPELKEAFKDYKRHPCIDYDYIEKRIIRFIEDLKKKVEKWQKGYPFDVENDDVLKWITQKYKGKVGDDNTTEELLNIYKEGAVRYRAQVPPGYKDANDPAKKEAGERYIYGDLIIWKSVLAKAREDKVDIIFLTNDNKEDWYEKYKGQTRGPRFELLREFHKETNQDIIILSEASFLKEMKEKNSVKVKDSSIEDAQGASSFVWHSPLEWNWPYVNSFDRALSPNTVLGVPNTVLGVPDMVLGVPNTILGTPNTVLGTVNAALSTPNTIMGAPNTYIDYSKASTQIGVSDGIRVFADSKNGLDNTNNLSSLYKRSINGLYNENNKDLKDKE